MQGSLEEVAAWGIGKNDNCPNYNGQVLSYYVSFFNLRDVFSAIMDIEIENMHTKEILRKLTKNLHEKFVFLPSKLAGMEVIESKHLTLINSHLDTDMFNILFVNDTDMPNELELVSYLEHFKQEKLPFAFWLLENEEKQMKKLLDSQNLICMEEELVMAIDLNNMSIRAPTNEELVIKKLKSNKQMEDWCQVFGELLLDEYQAISTFYQNAYPLIQEHNEKIKCFVGYLAEKPVTTGALFYSENIAGVFDMITIPEAQRRGITTTMMLHALKVAKEDEYPFATFGASEEDKHVYSKLGFEVYCVFNVYGLM